MDIPLSTITKTVDVPNFSVTLSKYQIQLDRQQHLNTLQINLGKLCNLACHHCHVDAGPKRTEIMTWQTMERILELLDNTKNLKRVDLTGGAPEMNPHFKHFVEELSKRGIHIIDRCNLTVLFEDGMEDMAEFLAQHNIEVVASLPCYTQDNVDKQRGNGTFIKSIKGLQKLNDLGYGIEQNKPLNLVYNPIGASLPPEQSLLEADYKERLKQDFDISFNNLLTITNIPIKRFEHQLKNEGTYDDYMQLLFSSFNPATTQQVMCLDQISVSWDGKLYDCDFNQMLEMPVEAEYQTLWDIKSFSDLIHDIALDNHCYGCTAGSGSSCSGSLS